MQPGSFYARISAMACVAVVLLAVVLLATGRAAAQDTVPSTTVQPVRVVRSEQLLPTSPLAEKLAQQVTIYRDPYGVPHIDGPTDASVVFGFAFAQAEDYFWQIEDSYVLALGRYSEIHGGRGLNSDLLNRAFEVTRRSRAEFEQLAPAPRRLCEAYAAGLNFYLDTHWRSTGGSLASQCSFCCLILDM